MPKRDVIAIIGTTGVGKTQLAIDLARWVKARGSSWPKEAELINADSMQVYRGLDIITNKATIEEREEFPHHLIDILDPSQEYRVDHFREDAMRTIDEITARGNLPVLVGGTMYFLQHLLFPGRLLSAEKEERAATPTHRVESMDDLTEEQKNRVLALPTTAQNLLFTFDTFPQLSSPDSFPPEFPVARLPEDSQSPEAYTAAVYQCLQAIDPEMGTRWHWRDIRKVGRSLQVFMQTGRLHSDIVKGQAQTAQDSQYRTLIFWPYASPEVLDQRLDTRVEQMCTRGLLEEVRELRKFALENGHIDLSKGIYQAIGYKEFSEFLEKQDRKEAQQSGSESTTAAEYGEALTNMETSTRQYARRQIKWIRNQLQPVVKACKSDGREDDVHLFLLDATSVAQWSEHVQGPAQSILQAFMERKSPLPEPESLSEAAAKLISAPTSSREEVASRAKIPCEICTIDAQRPFLVEENQMHSHKGSRGHRRRVQRIAKNSRLESPDHPRDKDAG